MTRSMKQFFDDAGGQESAHGGKLHWPGTPEGFPFRGEAAPNLKQHETTEMPLAMDYHSRLFQTWVEEDKRAFDLVMNRIVNGWYMQHKRIDKEVDGELLPAIWLEWVQIYGEQANQRTPGVQPDERTRSIQIHPNPSPSILDSVTRPITGFNDDLM